MIRFGMGGQREEKVRRDQFIKGGQVTIGHDLPKVTHSNVLVLDDRRRHEKPPGVERLMSWSVLVVLRLGPGSLTNLQARKAMRVLEWLHGCIIEGNFQTEG